MKPAPNQLKTNANLRYIVGVDPDLERSGVAIFDNENHTFTTLKVADLAQLQLLIFSSCPAKDTLIVVEAGWLNEGYHHYASLPRDFKTWGENSKRSYLIQCGVRVGRNFGVGQTIVAVLRANGYAVEERKPVSGKWDADTFKRTTGEKKGYNPEIRDAVRTIYPLIQYQLNTKRASCK